MLFNAIDICCQYKELNRRVAQVSLKGFKLQKVILGK